MKISRMQFPHGSKVKALLVLSVLAAGKASAGDTSGTLYYTTFSGGNNVHKVDYTWSGGALSFSGNTDLAAVFGADGLLFLPDGNLAVGGQGLRVHEITLGGTLVTTLAVPTDSYHLSLSPQGKVLYSASIPGQPSAITLNAGSLVGATVGALPTSGTQSVLDTIAFDNSGNSLYTSSGAGGNGVVGKISFTGGPEAPTAATTSSPVAAVASHGLVFDPFSGDYIAMGDNAISRFDANGNLLETRLFAANSNFDQGTVDGQGHIFAANNGGDLYLIDYSSDGTLANASFDAKFLAGSLDDIAPKVGSGSKPTPDAGGTAALTLLGLAGLGIVHRAQRRAGK